MNSLDRAKRFLAGKTSKLALTAVPLALAVPSVFATVPGNTVQFSSGSCIVTVGSGTCAEQNFSNIGGNSLANWIDVYTPGPLGTSGSSSIDLTLSGSASGTLTSGEVFPVSWDFSFFAPSQGLSNQLNQGITGSVCFDIGSTRGTAQSCTPLAVSLGETTGSAALTVNFNSGGTAAATGYSIGLSFSNVPNNWTLSIPQGTSLDLNPSSAPEPDSSALAGLGLAATGLLALFRRFRRKNV